MEIQKPYLLFLGDAAGQDWAKMAVGIAAWTPENVIGTFSLPGCKAKLDLPEINFEEALRKGAATLVIGVVNSGGFIPENWIKSLCEALEVGLDIASGMHTKLAEIPEVRRAAEKHGRRLIDVRYPEARYQTGTGRARTGKRLLTVGTDCSVGKMFTSLAITKELKKRGQKADFRATGQTGIMIAGSGCPVDAVVADFIAGAAEALSPDNSADHWDVLEGQGSLHHPAFAGVSLGLLHGAQADALVLCHKPTRTEMRGTKGYTLPEIGDCTELNVRLARRTNPAAVCVGISLNTSEMSEEEARKYAANLEKETGLPCTDPVRWGVEKIVDALTAG